MWQMRQKACAALVTAGLRHRACGLGGRWWDCKSLARALALAGDQSSVRLGGVALSWATVAGGKVVHGVRA